MVGQLINEYINVLSSISKCIPYNNYIADNRNKYFVEIKILVEKYKFIPRCKPLSDKVFYINNYKVNFPSINAILNDALFTDEQKEHIRKCKFYTKFCLHKGTNWAELNKKWSDEYVTEVEAKDKAEEEAFRKREAEYKVKTEKNYKEALAKANQTIDEWRKGGTKKEIYYTRYYANPDTRRIKAMDSVLYHTIFPNTQLRIRPDKPNWIETSRGALVPLETAINIIDKADNFVVDKNGAKPTLVHEGDNEYVAMWVDDEFCTIKDFEADNPGKAITIAYNWCIENKLININ